MRVTIDGTPCWVDLQSPDPVAAGAFYGAVLGWTLTDPGAAHGGYRLASAGEHTVAGVGPQRVPGHAAWTVYLAVADADATAAAVTGAGGSVLNGPGAVGAMGRSAVCADPSGATFGIWQAASHPGFDAMGAHGTCAWFEVNTPDGPAVRDFYASCFGGVPEKLDGMDYWTLRAGGRPRYGVLQMTAEWEGMAAHWMTYFAVDDVDAAAERVAAAGGRVAYGPFDTPFGRIAVCADPHGAPFSLMTPAAGPSRDGSGSSA